MQLAAAVAAGRAINLVSPWPGRHLRLAHLQALPHLLR